MLVYIPDVSDDVVLPQACYMTNAALVLDILPVSVQVSCKALLIAESVMTFLALVKALGLIMCLKVYREGGFVEKRFPTRFTRKAFRR